MAGRRMIDARIWESEQVASLTMQQRLLWIGLITRADDQGRGKSHPGLVGGRVFPYDNIDDAEIEADIQSIADIELIILYQTESSRLYQIIKWWEHQTPSWAWPSKLPAPEGWKDRWCFWNGKKSIFKNWVHSDKPNWWKKLRRKIMRRDNGTCRYCGKPAQHIDHVIPRSRGGSDKETNLVAACATCNLKKGARTPREAGMVKNG